MRIFLILSFCVVTSFVLTSCKTTPSHSDNQRKTKSTLPSTFTTENIMKVHQGMSSIEIQTLFGDPIKVTKDRHS